MVFLLSDLMCDGCCCIAAAVNCGHVEAGSWPSTIQYHSCSWCTYPNSNNQEELGDTNINARYK